MRFRTNVLIVCFPRIFLLFTPQGINVIGLYWLVTQLNQVLYFKDKQIEEKGGINIRTNKSKCDTKQKTSCGMEMKQTLIKSWAKNDCHDQQKRDWLKHCSLLLI